MGKYKTMYVELESDTVIEQELKKEIDRLKKAWYELQEEVIQKGKEIVQLKKEKAGLYTEAEYRELEKDRDEWERKYLDIT